MGSPKKNGKTATTLKMFEKIMTAQDHDVERVNIVENKIGCCVGCYACMDKKG